MTPPSHGLRQVKDAPMTRLVVVDDQAMIRAGFRSLLNAEADLEVVGEAANGQEAIDIVGRLRPDVTLMDIRMPVLDGLAATQAIMGAGMPTRVLMLTTFALDEYVFDALRAGASGFLLKDASAEELAAAIRVVAAGDSLLAPAVTRQVIDAFVGLGGATARRPQARLAHPTRAGGARPNRPRELQRRHRDSTVHLGGNHQDTREQPPRQTRTT
jgi:DNA-binding NarL/FixJ family response regulator